VSPRFPVVEAKDLVRIARKLGFELDHQKGSHAVLRRAADRARVVIPMHVGRSIRPKTLSGILEDLGITLEQLRELL
jgi:predicted RNA binding protein YcfA (HicA-like mRNA interferase family)